MSRQVLVIVRLTRYDSIAHVLAEGHGLGPDARRLLDQQVHDIVQRALKTSDVVSSTLELQESGGARLVFESPLAASRFAGVLHHVAADVSRGREESQQRVFKVVVSFEDFFVVDDGDEYQQGIRRDWLTPLDSKVRAGEVIIDDRAWQMLPAEEQELYGRIEIARVLDVIPKEHQEGFENFDDIKFRRRRPLLDNKHAETVFLKSLDVRDLKVISRANLTIAEASGSAPGWYVLAGGNGSGKSTLLRSIAAVRTGKAVHLFLDKSWIQKDCENAEVDADYIHDCDGRDTIFAGRLTFQRSEPETLTTMDDAVRDIVSRSFLAGYGSFKRLAGGSDHARGLAEKDAAISRVITLFLEEAALWEVHTWLSDMSHDGDRGLFREEIVSLLNSGLIPTGFRVKEIVGDDVIISTPEGSDVSLKATSDGIRSMVSMVLDILRGLEDCYGSVDLVDDVVNDPGVVLIDEPDNHLHVLWQVKLATWMKEHFPRIQFIVASHSPFICVGADKIWRLDDENGAIAPRELPESEMREIWNGSVRTILQSDAFRVFNTLHPETQERRIEYLRLKELSLRGRRLSPEQRECLKELEKQLSGPGIAPDPEFDKLFP